MDHTSSEPSSILVRVDPIEWGVLIRAVVAAEYAQIDGGSDDGRILADLRLRLIDALEAARAERVLPS